VATGKVVEFSSEKLRRLRDEICQEHGFSPLSHQFHIFALSPEAQTRAEDGAPGNGAAAAPPPLAERDERREGEDGEADLAVPER
jgi:hypothetical protein